MSNQYRNSKDVPNKVLAQRLDYLSDVVSQHREIMDREFDMRLPAEVDRDADIVLYEASRRLNTLDQTKERISQLERMLNPREWTMEMNAAWHRNIPDVQAAFEALREAVGDA